MTISHPIALVALGLCLVLASSSAEDSSDGSAFQEQHPKQETLEETKSSGGSLGRANPISENEIQVKFLAEKALPDDAAIRAAETYESEHIPPEPATDYDSSQSTEEEPLASASHDDHHDHHHPKVGLSVGGPLVNIAQGAAAQAHNFEKSQPAAAAQAAYVAKNRLGQSAGLSAATAAAAFAGKQIILRGLEQQTYNAHRALESEKLQLQQAQRAATAAANSAQQAMHQVQVVTTALNAAQATSQHASAAASAAAAELAAQTAMVGAAKARVQALEDQLHHARVDFEAAQRANFQAAEAARLAQSNAAAAAAHAAEVANANHHHHHHHHTHHEHHRQEHQHQEDEASSKQQNLQAETADESSSSAAEEPDDRESVPVGRIQLSSAMMLQQPSGVDELHRANLGLVEYLGVPGAVGVDRSGHPVPDELYVYDSFPY